MFKRIKIIRPGLVIFMGVAVLALFSAISFAGEGEKIAWNTILPEENNISLQSQKVVTGLEVTLFELEAIINKKMLDGEITNDTDFTTDGDVAIVYDYLMFRIYELTKVDRKIKTDFTAQEDMKSDYEKTVADFFNSLDNFKRAVYVSDLSAGIKNLKESMKGLRSSMNLYTSYHVAIAAR
ncbi:MAG: hypothetical protein HZA08_05990 [Nitrospirae bacterium]|nr:hypothetical protein [Nitrospirota bacterium]